MHDGAKQDLMPGAATAIRVGGTRVFLMVALSAGGSSVGLALWAGGHGHAGLQAFCGSVVAVMACLLA